MLKLVVFPLIAFYLLRFLVTREVPHAGRVPAATAAALLELVYKLAMK